jgi:hypothetical protein
VQFVISVLELLRRFGAKLGPYVLLELLLPGGTLFALLLFLYQRWKLNAGSFATRIGLASPAAVVSMLGRRTRPYNGVTLSPRMISAFACGR